MLDVFEIFNENADSKRAEAMSAYMKNICPFLGIPKPKRAELSKDFIKQAKKAAAIDWEFVDRCWRLEREFQYLALDYLMATEKHLTVAHIPKLKKLAETKPWWDTIDSLIRPIGNIALKNPETNGILLEWSVDSNFWLRRVAINHQIGRRERTDAELLEAIIVNNFGSKEFFINKAIGWSLRDYSKTNPGWVRKFIGKHKNRMANLSIREASKYI
jgi:3-methyladenine DNA glycosylase AlkD